MKKQDYSPLLRVSHLIFCNDKMVLKNMGEGGE